MDVSMDVSIDDEDKARSEVVPAVRRVNSSWLRRIVSAGSKADQASAACDWAEQAMVLSAGAPGVHVAELSFGIAMAHVRRFAGMREPIRVKRLGVAM
jgi:phosphoglycerate dehydrogenase-like enzyme